MTKTKKKEEKKTTGPMVSLIKLTDTERKTLIGQILALPKRPDGSRRGKVDLRLMEVDESYQRKPEESRIRGIIKEYRDYKIGVLLVSYRNGRFYIVDGQHRFLALIRMGLVQEVDCIIMEWTQDEEAVAFRNQYDNTRKLSNSESFRSGIVGHDEIDCAILALCDSYNQNIRGYNSNSHPAPQAITAISQCRKIAARENGDGIRVLEWIFALYDYTHWFLHENMGSATTLSIMEAVYYDARRNNALGEYTQRLAKELSTTTPEDVKAYGINEYKKDARTSYRKAMLELARGNITVGNINKAYNGTVTTEK